MDPSIGYLVPVLDSYWLIVHVAIIVASYCPFTIGMILGMLSLILYIFTNKKNKKKNDSFPKNARAPRTEPSPKLPRNKRTKTNEIKNMLEYAQQKYSKQHIKEST